MTGTDDLDLKEIKGGTLGAHTTCGGMVRALLARIQEFARLALAHSACLVHKHPGSAMCA